MNKRLLTAALAGAMILSTGAYAMAAEQIKCEKTKAQCMKKPVCGLKECPPPMAKTPEEKRAEFEKRMQLSDAQKAQLKKIKEDEQKKLEPIQKKMIKIREQERELVKKQLDIRSESMKKFDEILTADQKAEMEKMKSEIHEQIKKDMEKFGQRRPKGPHCPHDGKMMPPPDAPQNCPPECKCPCHKPNHIK